MRTAGLTICCALGASAFLLPPSVNSESVRRVPGLSFAEVDTKNQLFQLPCSSCAGPVASGDIKLDNEEELFFVQGGAQDLLLNFTVSDDGKGLLLNEQYIYPVSRVTKEEIYLDQIPPYLSPDELHADNIARTPVAASEWVLSSERLDTPDEEAFIHLKWQLMTLENNMVLDSVSPVLVQLIETTDGELLILDISSVRGEKAPLPPLFPPKQIQGHKRPCNMARPFCAISDFIGSTFGSAGMRRPCPGRKHKFDGEHLPTHIRPPFGRNPPPGLDGFEHFKGMKDALDGPPFGRPHHGHRHGHHHRHGFFSMISRAILAVLIPIMAGITVGIIVSVSGLLFGQLLGWLCFTAFRGKRREYTEVAVEEGLSVDEKDAALFKEEDEQPLPRYEDAPAYEEVTKTEA